ncbi:protein lethal(2)essential for life-like [Pectinophora gossypiella]|uniref:protein lethal(2)essential for life-like n=1 Tax=Pectinophora gossypiella TaxID=13191 RepID=UPI00214F20FA|nr:protein lethal(2)essential for life-like [Pectinophora gossypiella]
MALLPYLLDELRPRRARDHLLGLDLSPDDFLTDIFDRPALQIRRYMRPWKNLSALAKDVGSTIKSDKEKFQVNLDVQHFAPEEISVKTSDGYVVIEGKHEERKDEHGFVSRHFKRRYALPEDCNPETVESKLSSDGVLTVIAPKVSSGKDEKVIPITHTGPVRRKAIENDEEMNGQPEPEEKSPQKKRRR